MREGVERVTLHITTPKRPNTVSAQQIVNLWKGNPPTPSDKKQKKNPPDPNDSAPSSPHRDISTHIEFTCVTININGFTPKKWKYILSLPAVKTAAIIIITEHHLSATFQPKEVVDSGWNVHAVAGIPKEEVKNTTIEGE